MATRLEEGDEERVRYLETLKNGSRFRGYVGFDRQRAERPIAEHLGMDKDGFIYLMIDHLESGGRLDRVDETRPEWTNARSSSSACILQAMSRGVDGTEDKGNTGYGRQTLSVDLRPMRSEDH